MKNELQDVMIFEPAVKNAFTKNPKRSISALYRRARNNPRLSLIGCYPILAVITHAAIEMGIPLSRKGITYAFNMSAELYLFQKRDKTGLIDYLCHPPQDGLKETKHADNLNENI